MAKKLSRNGFALLAGIIVSLLLIVAVLAFVFVLITPSESGDSLILDDRPLSAEEMKREDAPKILEGTVPDAVPEQEAGNDENNIYYYDDGTPVDADAITEESGPADGAHLLPTDEAAEDFEEGVEDATDGVIEPADMDEAADDETGLDTDTNR